MRRNIFAVQFLLIPLLAWVFFGLGDKTDYSQNPVPQAAPAAVPVTFEPIASGQKAARAFFERGNAWKEAREYDKAIKEYDEAIRLDPNYALAYANRAEAWCDGKMEFDRAFQDCDRAIQLDSKLAVAFAVRAGVWNCKQDYDKAIQDANEAVKLDPKSAMALFVRANIWNMKREFTKAIADCDEALRLDPNCGNAYCNRADARLNKQDYGDAVKDYNESIRLDPKNSNAFNNRGFAYKNLGILDLAFRDFEEAIRLNPNIFLFHFNRGDIRRLKKDFGNAQMDLDHAIQMVSKTGQANNDKILSLIYYAKGLCHVDQGQTELAIDPLRKSVKLGWDVFSLAQDERMKSLRGNPEFQKLVQENLPVPPHFAPEPRVMAPPPLPAEVNQSPATNSIQQRSDPLAITEIKELLKKNADYVREIQGSIKPGQKGIPPPGNAQAASLPKDGAPMTNTGPVPLAPMKGKREIDLARVRKLVEFPSLYIDLFCSFNSDQRDRHGNLRNRDKEIADLQAKLNGSTADGEIYVELAHLYEDQKHPKKSQEMAQKAEQLLRPYVNTSDPKDCLRLVTYAHAQAFLNPEGWQDLEKWVRQAVTLDPKDWHAWEKLGLCCGIRAERLVLGGRCPTPGNNHEALDLLISGTVTAATLAEVEKVLDEARHCYGRAKDLAPDSEEQWDARVSYLYKDFSWKVALQTARGNPPQRNFRAVVPKEWTENGFQNGDVSLENYPELLVELGEWAQRCPDHLGAQFTGGSVTLGLLMKRRETRVQPNPQEPLLTKSEAQFLNEALARMEKIGQQGHGETSQYCANLTTYLFVMFTMFDETKMCCPAAVAFLRRALEADPKNEKVAEILECLLTDQKRYEEVLEVAKVNAAYNATPRSKFLLARSYAYAEHREDADREIAACLREHPDDPRCLAGRAVLLLQFGDDKVIFKEEDVDEAGRLLDKARANYKREHSQEQTGEDLEFLSALQQAFSGEVDAACFKLKLLRSSNPKNNRYNEALEALGDNGDTFIQTDSAILPPPPPEDSEMHSGGITTMPPTAPPPPPDPIVFDLLSKGQISFRAKEYDKALESFKEVVRLDANFFEGYLARSLAWRQLKVFDKAIADLQEAQRINSKRVEVHNALAWLLATCPDAQYRDGAKAIAAAQKALELNKNDGNIMDTLAAAYAEAGNFEHAVQWQERAVESRPYEDNFKRRLELYVNKTPYREE